MTTLNYVLDVALDSCQGSLPQIGLACATGVYDSYHYYGSTSTKDRPNLGRSFTSLCGHVSRFLYACYAYAYLSYTRHGFAASPSECMSDEGMTEKQRSGCIAGVSRYVYVFHYFRPWLLHYQDASISYAPLVRWCKHAILSSYPRSFLSTASVNRCWISCVGGSVYSLAEFGAQLLPKCPPYWFQNFLTWR